jgi:hypothetical protein
MGNLFQTMHAAPARNTQALALCPYKNPIPIESSNSSRLFIHLAIFSTNSRLIYHRWPQGLVRADAAQLTV